jgi:hypothetical protein
MFWILIFIISSTLSWSQIDKYYKRDKNNHQLIKTEDFSIRGVIYIIIAVCSTFIFLTQMIGSVTDYPYLSKQLSHVETLQNRIEDIRNSSYTYEKDGNFVAGSVENLNQSTNLSKYISELAIKEATYNEYLQEAKIYKDTFILWFFGDGWAISNKIDTLPIMGK